MFERVEFVNIDAPGKLKGCIEYAQDSTPTWKEVIWWSSNQHDWSCYCLQGRNLHSGFGQGGSTVSPCLRSPPFHRLWGPYLQCPAPMTNHRGSREVVVQVIYLIGTQSVHTQTKLAKLISGVSSPFTPQSWKQAVAWSYNLCQSAGTGASCYLRVILVWVWYNSKANILY